MGVTVHWKFGRSGADGLRCRVGAYARVSGVPREFRGKMTFDANFIRPVEDPHEVIFHFMEAVVVTLQYSRGQPPVCALRLLVNRTHLPQYGSRDLTILSLWR